MLWFHGGGLRGGDKGGKSAAQVGQRFAAEGTRAVKLLNESEEMQRRATEARIEAETLFNDDLGLDNSEAWNLINAFKPPK